MAGQRPLGVVTRGTTAPNRLRRCDRWIAGPEAWRLRRAGPAPLVVDLGFGASPVTVLELSGRLRRVRPDVEVVGIEIDPDRVRSARRFERPGVRFAVGGFEIPLPSERRPVVIR
ncbi:MAG: class I SAM-dependent methyltransferase, partial [Phycicoccus sp.]